MLTCYVLNCQPFFLATRLKTVLHQLWALLVNNSFINQIVNKSIINITGFIAHPSVCYYLMVPIFQGCTFSSCEATICKLLSFFKHLLIFLYFNLSFINTIDDKLHAQLAVDLFLRCYHTYHHYFHGL